MARYPPSAEQDSSTHGGHVSSPRRTRVQFLVKRIREVQINKIYGEVAQVVRAQDS